MTRIDNIKLAGLTPASSVKGDTHARAAGDRGDVQPTSPDKAATTARGVDVEVGNRIEPGQPPVDTDRVAEIRAALRDGSYPILPVEISDALIAARLMLGYSK